MWLTLEPKNHQVCLTEFLWPFVKIKHNKVKWVLKLVLTRDLTPLPPLPIQWDQGLVSIIQNVLETGESAIGKLVCKMHIWQLTNRKQLPNILWRFISGLNFKFITVWVLQIYPLFAIYGMVWKRLFTSGWPDKGTRLSFERCISAPGFKLVTLFCGSWDLTANLLNCYQQTC